MTAEIARGTTVAYFSMEIALDDAIPTYSGGLGVLAGDHLRAAADTGIPLVGVTLLYHDGYFDQHVDAEGVQHESPVRWDPATVLQRVPHHVGVPIGGRQVRVGAWRAVLTGVGGHQVPVYFLDTRVAGNSEEDQALTDALYGGDAAVRLGQEIVLGIGGVALLAALGHDVVTYHMNEGHSAVLALALLDRYSGGTGGSGVSTTSTTSSARSASGAAGSGSGSGGGGGGGGGSGSGSGGDEAWRAVRDHCVFTTHTPVAAGHDRFDRSLVEAMLGPRWTVALERKGLLDGGELNMTRLALAAVRRANAVSVRHAAVTRAMFPGQAIDAITNGVHAATWVADPVARLFDRHIPRWRADNPALRYAGGIPLDELQSAHAEAKRAMVAAVAVRTGVRLDPDALTLGVARRATAYKRTALVLSQPDRLAEVATTEGPVQFVFAGKAHPRDEAGKELIRRVTAASHELRDAVTVVFVEGYSLALARLLCGGVDVWCNTPVRPHEASGTSGMKAALNGVPSLSVLDGWWIEGNVEGVTGWSIGAGPDVAGAESGDPGSDPTYADDAASFSDKLRAAVAPLFYREPERFAAVMRSAIALNGSFFTTERMVREYAAVAYDLRQLPWSADEVSSEAGRVAGI